VVIFLRICHGCDQHPVFPAPSGFGGSINDYNSGKSGRENAESRPLRCQCPGSIPGIKYAAASPLKYWRLWILSSVEG